MRYPNLATPLRRGVRALALFLLCTPLAALAVPVQTDAAAAENARGEAVYAQRCATCHDNPDGRIPSRAFIALLKQPEAVVHALTAGVMQGQAAGLDAAEIDAVAEYITGKPLGSVPQVRVDPAANLCKAPPPPMTLDGPGWNGWGLGPDNTRFQTAPGLTVADLADLEVKWAFAIPGSVAWGQAVVAGGRVFSASMGGMVYSLDADSGCTYWARELGAPVRGTVSLGRLPGDGQPRYGVFFGEFETGLVHGLDAETGEPLWSTKVEQHPNVRLTAAPTLHDNRLFVPVSSMEEVAAGVTGKYPCCTFRGSVVALDTATGAIVWQGYPIDRAPGPTKINSDGTQMFGPAGAAVWSPPTVDTARGLVYAATGNSYTEVETRATDALVAFDIDTGERRWVSQVRAGDNSLVNCGAGPNGNCPQEEGPNLDFGSSPVLQRLRDGREIVAVGSESGIVYAFDPDKQGAILWEFDVGVPAGEASLLGGQAADRDTFYAANFQRPPLNEVIESGQAYEHLPGGALTALDLATGKPRWRVPAPEVPCAWGEVACSHGQRPAVTVIPGAVFAGAMDGRIRAYAADDGDILWEFDAGKPLAAVNGLQAGGGAIGEGGQTVIDGTVYVMVSSATGGASALVAFTPGGE